MPHTFVGGQAQVVDPRVGPDQMSVNLQSGARSVEQTHLGCQPLLVLSLALLHAVRAGVIARNPAEDARDDLPRGEASPERAVWTLEQLAAFLDATVSDPLYALWALAATTGLRRGELCGLRWDDLDLGPMSLTVRRCLVMVTASRQSPHRRRTPGNGR
jgi:integrase